MKLKPIIAVALCVPLLMGNQGGCDESALPTVRQVELDIPSNILTCKAWPASPGAKASSRVTAAWIVKAYDAYLSCGGNLAEARALYGKYKAEVKRINKAR